VNNRHAHYKLQVTVASNYKVLYNFVNRKSLIQDRKVSLLAVSLDDEEAYNRSEDWACVQ